MGVSSLPKTVTRQCRDCDLNPGSSAPESSTLTTRLPSHPQLWHVPKITRSSAIAEGRRDASCQLKSCQLPRNNADLYDKS